MQKTRQSEYHDAHYIYFLLLFSVIVIPILNPLYPTFVKLFFPSVFFLSLLLAIFLFCALKYANALASIISVETPRPVNERLFFVLIRTSTSPIAWRPDVTERTLYDSTSGVMFNALSIALNTASIGPSPIDDSCKISSSGIF